MSQKQAYEIGFFMIFTIALSRHNLNMEDIAKMKVFEFIKEYEKASVKLGKIPLITRNSKGILDLTQILKKIKQLEKDLKKNDLPWWRHYLGFGRI
jgi:3-dehydroquinate dehydratase